MKNKKIQLETLRCPICTREDKGELELYKEAWLICEDCNRRYPIWMGFPIMLIDESDKWQSVPKEDLPVPAPSPHL